MIVPSARPSLRQKGREGILDQGRHLVWSWWLWTFVAIIAAYADHRRMAIGTAVAAVITYLLAPQEHSPTYGLESRFPVPSGEFLNSMVGSTGVPFFPGNHVTLLNNGDEFYPAMLDDIHRAQRSVTIEAYIYWKGDVGMRFARALTSRAQAGAKVKILLDAVGSSTIGKEILEILESGGVRGQMVQPGAMGHGRTARHSSSMDALPSQAEPVSRTTGTETLKTRSTGAISKSVWTVLAPCRFKPALFRIG